MSGRTYRVPFPARGSILDVDELAAVCELVRSDHTLSGGEFRDRFERRFRDYIGTAHAISVTSGTVALELAIHLADLRPGDEVIVTPQTYQATIQPLLDREVKVTFCDVDPHTLNMGPDVLETLISDRTAAIVLVHYGGYPAEMNRIMDAARKNGAFVIEDCAHALGSSYHGRIPGSLADIGCFSFHSSKNLTTLGEGGMLTFDRDDCAERLARIRSNQVDGIFRPAGNHLLEPPALLPWMMFAEDVYQVDCAEVSRAGTNATLSEAAAAIGIVQMDRLAELSSRRRSTAHRLDKIVAGYEGLRLHRPPSIIEHAYHLYTFFVDAGADVRERLVRTLDRRGIEVQLRYFPLHLTPEWRSRGHGIGECPIAEQTWFSGHMNLPCHPTLSDEQIDYLVETLDRSLAEVLEYADDVPAPQPANSSRGAPCRSST